MWQLYADVPPVLHQLQLQRCPSLRCFTGVPGVQVVDDILDFTQTAEQLGKPRFQDIESGNLTAPTLYAMRKCPELHGLIEGEFLEEGSVERAVALIEQHGGAHPPPACLRVLIPLYQPCRPCLANV